MTEAERARFAEDGYLLRTGVLSPGEIDDLRATVEDVVAAVVARAEQPDAGPSFCLADGHRLQLSSRTAIQWEWREGSRAVRLLEPCDHLHPRLGALWDDPRLALPMQDVLGCDGVAPFTSKLNLKRGREGSPFPFHQDFPYWFVRVGEGAAEIATAMLLLDDAEESNGALRVVPGTHRLGPVPRDRSEPTRSLVDAARVDTSGEIVLEAPRGSVVWFGSFLVHRSSPNRSERDRRALLYSWQPPGRVRWQDAPYHADWLERLP